MMPEHTHNDGTIHDHYVFSERDHATDYGGLPPTAEHTPGPWTARDESIMRDDLLIARVIPAAPWERETVYADARLIAAAPDLLTTLEEVAELHDEHFSPRIRILLADAIAKATGTEVAVDG